MTTPGRPLRIALVGANGRMGLEISKLLQSEGNMVAALAVVRGGDNSTFKKISQNVSDIKKADIDVVIDFSGLGLLKDVLKQCTSEKIPLVSGVTGLKSEDFALVDQAAQQVPILWAANMSLGVAVFKKMIRILAEQPQFEFQISETHHNKKKDAPSGTALDLQKTLEQASGKSWPSPLAIRGGGVVGDHSLYALAEEEVIEITHRATNRAVFARGALRAAEFVAGKKPGRYQIEDLVKSAK